MNIRDIIGTRLRSDEVRLRVGFRWCEPVIVVPEHAVSIRLEEHVDAVEVSTHDAPFLPPRSCFALTEEESPVDAKFARLVVRDESRDAEHVVLVFRLQFSPRMGRHAWRRLRLVERSLR